MSVCPVYTDIVQAVRYSIELQVRYSCMVIPSATQQTRGVDPMLV